VGCKGKRGRHFREQVGKGLPVPARFSMWSRDRPLHFHRGKEILLWQFLTERGKPQDLPSQSRNAKGQDGLPLRFHTTGLLAWRAQSCRTSTSCHRCSFDVTLGNNLMRSGYRRPLLKLVKYNQFPIVLACYNSVGRRWVGRVADMVTGTGGCAGNELFDDSTFGTNCSLGGSTKNAFREKIGREHG